MISLSNIYNAIFDGLNRRVLNVWQYGAKTANECAPFGDDSNPIQGMDAIYAETQDDETPVIIGYLNTHQLAGPGEKRFYSLAVADDGTVTQAFYTWMKADGTYELGGTNDFLTRYNAANAALQAQVTKINAELTKIQAGIIAAGGTYAMTPISLDMSGAKITEIKCL